MIGRYHFIVKIKGFGEGLNDNTNPNTNSIYNFAAWFKHIKQYVPMEI
jgi:hypothetical protein